MRDRRPPEDLFDWAAIGGHVLLVLHSLRRHRLVFASVWVTVVGLSTGLMVALPKTYEVQTTLHAGRAQMLSSLGGSAPKEEDTPTKVAAQMVLRHDNLVALIGQTDLVHAWTAHRAPLLRLKDYLFARIFKPPSEQDLVEGFVGLLEKRLWVSTGEGVVTIGIRFPDPQLAFLVVDGALENFLEARHAAEISSIGEEISILQRRADDARQSLQRSVDELQSLRLARATKLGRRPRRVLEPLYPLLPDEKGSQLRAEVETKRRALADLEEFRRRRIAELEATLEEQKALYSEGHPAVQDARQTLEASRHESVQVQALRRELAPLEAELKQRGLLTDVPLNASRAREAALHNAALEPDDARETEDPEIEYSKSQLRYAIGAYNGLLGRIQAAQLEEETARAAFKYRYTILKPPQRPRGPVAPVPALVITASLLAGLLLGLLGTAFLDISSRKFLEPWQVEHALGVPLLGEVRIP